MAVFYRYLALFGAMFVIAALLCPLPSCQLPDENPCDKCDTARQVCRRKICKDKTPCGEKLCDPDLEICQDGECVQSRLPCGDDVCDEVTEVCRDEKCLAKIRCGKPEPGEEQMYCEPPDPTDYDGEQCCTSVTPGGPFGCYNETEKCCDGGYGCPNTKDCCGDGSCVDPENEVCCGGVSCAREKCYDDICCKASLQEKCSETCKTIYELCKQQPKKVSAPADIFAPENDLVRVNIPPPPIDLCELAFLDCQQNCARCCMIECPPE